MSRAARSQVEGLGKRYRLGSGLGHGHAPRERSRGCRRAGRRACGTAAPAGPERTLWALRDVSFEVAAGRGRRHHRPQRRGQEHAAQDPLPDHRADGRATRELRGRVGSLLEVGTGFHPELTGRENIYL